MPQVSRYVYNKFERDTSIELDRSFNILIFAFVELYIE